MELIIKKENTDKEILLKAIKLGTPIVISNLLYTVETAVSLVLVSHLGAKAIAAVGYSISVLWFMYSFIALTYTGTSVLIAQRIGAQKDPSPVFSVGMLISLLISIPLMFFGTSFSAFLMKEFGAPKDVIMLSKDYLSPIFKFIFLAFATEIFYASYSGFGQTKTPFKVSLVMNIFNIVSSYILINGKFGVIPLGVKGAGIGIVLSEIIGFLIYIILIAFFKIPFKFSPFIDKNILIEMIKLGTPVFIERFVSSLSFNIFVGFLAKFGPKVLAAHQIGLRIESFSYMIGLGFSIASSTIAGQNYGAKNIEGAKRAIFLIGKLSALIMGILGFLMAILSKFLAEIFTNDKEVIYYSIYYLILVGISQVPLSYTFILAGALRGLSKTTTAMLISIFSFWFFRILPIYIIMKFINSPFVAWIFMPIEVSIRAIIYYLAFLRVKHE